MIQQLTSRELILYLYVEKQGSKSQVILDFNVLGFHFL